MSANGDSRIYSHFEDRRMVYMPTEPVFAGGRSRGYIFERHNVRSSGFLPTHSFDQHIFMLPTGSTSALFRSRLNGRKVNGLIEPGRFRFVAAGDTISTAWDSPLEVILVTLHPDLLQRALGEDAGSRPVELLSIILPHEDPVLAHLTFALQSFVTSDRIAGRLFEQSLLCAMAARLINCYAQGTRAKSRGAPLTRWQRASVEGYIRQNLSRAMHLAEIAAVVNMSPHHLSRTFRVTTGRSLWQFVIECRARKAMEIISRNPSQPLSHVATACGFESYSQFIAAFRKVIGQLPSEYRRTQRL